MFNKHANNIQKREPTFMESAAVYSMDRRSEELIDKLSHNLGERVKELSCLYGISKLVEKPGTSLDEILQGTVDLIPPSWQYPDCACARIILRNRKYQTVNFRETIWKQMSNINVNDERIGTLEVCYLKEKPESDEGPFLKEERSLLNVIAERLGKIVERTEAREALIESEERYRILTEKVADGVSLIQAGRFVFVNNAFASMLGYPDSKGLIGKEAIELVSEDFEKEFIKLHEDIETGASQEGIFNGKCLTGQGREFWVEAHFNIITWQGKPAYLHTTRDITETKHREIAMQQEADRLQRENFQLKSNIKDRYRFGDIIGKSPAMQEVYEHILSIAASDAGVVVYGESGTGKELVSRAIHNLSKRHNESFVAVNCGAIPETLFESEFFGYDKGAFTGANKDKLGFFDLAHNGTLFLDELGEIAPNMQVKLLRAIEGGEYIPVGSEKTRKVDVRIIGATNKDLKEQVKKGLVREDFFYRIHIVSIHIPPLRERKEDIPLLVDYFLKSYCNGGKCPSIPAKIMDVLCNYHWPGNIRELQNALHRYLTVKKLDLMETSEATLHNAADITVEKTDLESLNFHDAIEKSQRNVIVSILDQTHWHRGNAASVLGMDRKTLYRKMKNFGLN